MSSETRKLAPVYEMLRYRVPVPTVLILDDQSTGRLVLAEVIKSIDQRINIMTFSDSAEAVEYVRYMSVDLILTDFRMPRMNGIETIRQLRALYPAEQLPIIMTTVVSTRDILYRAFEAGVSDYLLRPVDPVECRVRCENLLRQRAQYLLNERQTDRLNDRLEQIKGELRISEQDTIWRLAALMRLHDGVAAIRQRRVALYAGVIAQGLGCSDEETQVLKTASQLLDIGELALDPALFSSTEALASWQIREIRRHPRLGYELLAGSTSRYMQAAATIALNHHERMDGSGYPNGLIGDAIPSLARIVAVADVFDALTSHRPYRAPLEWAPAMQYMRSDLQDKLDANAVGVLTDSTEQIRRICHGMSLPFAEDGSPYV